MSRVQIYPHSGNIDLQFHEILREIKRYCLSELTLNKIDNIYPGTHVGTINKFLTQTEECMQALETDNAPEIIKLADVKPYLSSLHISDYILPPEHLIHIIKLLRHRIRVKVLIEDKGWQEQYPMLHELLQGPFPPVELLTLIDSIFDENGNIKEDASPELIKIQGKIISKQSEINRSFKSIVKSYREMDVLTDTEESIRSGRRVISIAVTHKRTVNGILHDESSSGKTLFIEPQEIIPLNNDLFHLFLEKEKEIKRLHKLVTARIADIVDNIPVFQNIMTWYELIYAKAKYSMSINGRVPVLRNKNEMHIQNARHPILYLKNKKTGIPTVPFSLDLNDTGRVLLVSGPNAGGKSILLKSIGLIQLMVQSGIPVPLDSSSEIGVFQKFFVDIGDQQSVDDDLSTYSSHLTNMKVALQKADKHSMILLDEYGAGTDPQVGGAIAESILEQLMVKHVYGVITTHYSNLKSFASSHSHILNGAMLFDNTELKPTYQLEIGRPGSSYAFEIAKNIGLPKHTINRARKIVGAGLTDVDDLLIELQEEKARLEGKLLDIEKRERQLDKLTLTYNHLQSELEIRRKRMKMEAKENALQFLATQKKELDSLIRKIKENKNLAEAEKLKKRIKEKQQHTVHDVREIEEELIETDKTSGNIEIGSYVKMRKGEGLTGEVEAVMNNVARVIIGNMQMEVKLKDLKLINEPITIGKRTTQHNIELNLKVESKIDIRGLDKKNATDVLEKFFDKVIMADLPSVEVIHGKGTGALRKLTSNVLKQYKDVEEISHPPAEEGGIGKSIVKFK